MHHRPAVAVVILNWNGLELLREFLPSVVEYSRSDRYDCKVYVADNASTDDSVEFVRQTWGDSVGIIRNTANFGYARGYNEALKALEEDYFVLLNSDVEVTSGWIEPILDLMESDDSVAACQPKLLTYNARDTFEYAGAAGGYLDKFGYPFCRGRIFHSFENDEGQYDDTVEIFWASGAAMFIRADLFKITQGFEEDFFAHMEEIDLCWRLHRMGYRIMSVPASVVYHLGGGTLTKMNPRKTYLNFRNNRLLITKHIERWAFPLHYMLRNFLDLIAVLQAFLHGKFREGLAILQALIDYHIMLPAWIRKRRTDHERILKKLRKDPLPVPLYNRSIVFLYFVRGIRKFSELP
jgi:GT2 family glycosyltransferase